MGERVLDFFYQSDQYNLIFAPHVLLFHRPWTKGARLPARFQSTDRIRIDKGSRASVDMSYVRAADIYLGDLSSQIYEFIHQPRPCVFLNAHGVAWQDDRAFAAWHFGPVIDDVCQLEEALEQAQ